MPKLAAVATPSPVESQKSTRTTRSRASSPVTTALRSIRNSASRLKSLFSSTGENPPKAAAPAWRPAVPAAVRSERASIAGLLVLKHTLNVQVAPAETISRAQGLVQEAIAAGGTDQAYRHAFRGVEQACPDAHIKQALEAIRDMTLSWKDSAPADYPWPVSRFEAERITHLLHQSDRISHCTNDVIGASILDHFCSWPGEEADLMRALARQIRHDQSRWQACNRFTLDFLDHPDGSTFALLIEGAGGRSDPSHPPAAGQGSAASVLFLTAYATTIRLLAGSSHAFDINWNLVAPDDCENVADHLQLMRMALRAQARHRPLLAEVDSRQRASWHPADAGPHASTSFHRATAHALARAQLPQRPVSAPPALS